jgi:lipopolysaccharide heptosyltransferase II
MSWSSARRVLCVRLDTLGDVLMTTPALRAIKEGHPQRHLTLLTSTPGAVVGRLVPEVDDVWTYDAPWLKASAARSDAALDRAVVDRLRAGRFDAAVVFTVYSQNPLPAALLTFLADIPLRLAHCRENPYQLLTDWVRETEPERGVRHEVTRQLDLAAAVGLSPSHQRLSLRPCPEDHLAAEHELRRLRLGRRWAVVHAGATASSRRYPPAAFAVVARSLVRDHGVDLVFTGTGDEAALVEQIRGAAGVTTHSLAGRLSLGALAAVIGRAGLLISNNTGPAHVAAAMGTPVVDLYALTNPQHTPWAVPARVLNHPVPCAPCYRSICPEGHHLCLRGVPPAAVVAAALELLQPGAREAATTATTCPLALS